ncbi:MAG: hypothetical protein O7B79_04960 [SAR324 cluster bacterium]|nr:hypothetical protein [SAR324 cluster bacterium]
MSIAAEEQPGWITYTIRKTRPLGARWAGYRIMQRLPGYLRSLLTRVVARVIPAIRAP